MKRMKIKIPSGNDGWLVCLCVCRRKKKPAQQITVKNENKKKIERKIRSEIKRRGKCTKNQME